MILTIYMSYYPPFSAYSDAFINYLDISLQRSDLSELLEHLVERV